MGGCASKPKGSDEMLPKPLPINAQTNPKEVENDAKPPGEEVKQAEPEPQPQFEPEPTKVIVDEKINEAPLVDLSEPKQEEVTTEKEAHVCVVETGKELFIVQTAPTASHTETKVEEFKAKPEPVVEAVVKVENKNEDAPLVTL